MTLAAATRRARARRGRARYDHPVDRYAFQILDGELPAGKLHRAAAVRHISDRRRRRSAEFPYVFRPELADARFRFYRELRFYKGRVAGQRFELEPFQQFIVGSLFGWVHVDTGLRRFRTAYVELPRKTGKSHLAAGVILTLAFFDHEPASEAYCAATKRDQARLVFDVAKQFVLRNPWLRRRVRVLASNMHHEATSSKLEPLGRDKDSMDGLDVSGAVVDEYHAHKTAGVLNVIESATGAREQPLVFIITTAGTDPVSPCGEQHDYARKVLEGVLEDPSYFAFIAHADPKDDPLDPRTWAKATPNLGVSVRLDDLRAQARKAAGIPSALQEFKQKRLNLWTGSGTPWIDLEQWNAGQRTDWTAADLVGRWAIGGLDLSSKIDLTAFDLLFPPTDDDPSWRLLVWLWMPEGNVDELEKKHHAPYREWIDRGLIRTIPGKRIRHEPIVELVEELRDAGFVFDAVGYDPWNQGDVPGRLEDLGVEAVEVGQTFKHLNEATKDLEATIKEGRLDAGDHAVMRWMASNVTVARDRKGDIRPVRDKEHQGKRIDGIAAMVTARAALYAVEGENAASRDFEERGLHA